MRTRIPLKTVLKRPSVLTPKDTGHTCGKCGHLRLAHVKHEWLQRVYRCRECGCVRTWGQSDHAKVYRNDIGKLTARKHEPKHKRLASALRRPGKRDNG